MEDVYDLSKAVTLMINLHTSLNKSLLCSSGIGLLQNIWVHSQPYIIWKIFFFHKNLAGDKADF